jgi:hypothetical protein
LRHSRCRRNFAPVASAARIHLDRPVEFIELLTGFFLRNTGG